MQKVSPMTVQNLILFANVSDFEVSGLSFYHQRWWAINNYACHHGVFRNLHFEANDRRYLEDGTLVHKLEMYNITVEDVIECEDEVKAHMVRGFSAIRIGDDTPYGDFPADENRMHHITVKSIRSGGIFVLDLAGKMRDVTVEDYAAANAETQVLRSTASGTRILLSPGKNEY